MADTLTYTRGFAGGEVTKEFFGRIDDAKFQMGLALCRNFIVLPHGPAANRPGTRFVREVKDSTKYTRLIKFNYADDQTLAIEFGAGYFRFHTMGATVLLAGVPYEIANTYTEAQLKDVSLVQSADVLTLAHPSHPVRELRRLGATNWTLTDVTFAPQIAAPGGVNAVATTGITPGTRTTQEYVVTAIFNDGIDESRASSVASCSNNLFDDGAYNTITWSAVATAVRYNVFKKTAGLFGYIGQTDDLSFVDDNIAADVGKTPPIAANPFNAANKYPAVVTYFDQRRLFSATNTEPQRTWATKEGTESNLDASLPVQDTDAISFRIAARDANRIRHMVPMNDLILLTSTAVWRVWTADGSALTPTGISARVQATTGSSKASPVTVNNVVLYASARGGHLYELGYSYDVGGYRAGDVSLRAPHLFDGFSVVQMDYASAPYPIVWAVSSSGKLIGLTYVPEQQIGAFHQHDTLNGTFESVTVIPEGDEDAVYVVVRRLIAGQLVRYVERFASRRFATQSDAFFVDCGVTYQGDPAMTFSGLDWLEGQTVNILADGAVAPPQVVVGGEVTIDEPASVVHIGLPIQADIQTLPLSFQIPGYGAGRPKNVADVFLRVYRSGGIFAGPDFDNLSENKQRTTESYGTAPAIHDGEVEILIDSAWTDDGSVCIRQNDPLPLTILALALAVAVGGG